MSGGMRRPKIHTLLNKPLLFIRIVFILCGFLYLSSRLTATRHANDDDTRPRFLSPSSFRNKPDLAYEKRISTALQGIEKAVLAENGGDTLAEERIWQIAKNEAQRGSDSLSLEHHNSEWEYALVTDEKAINFVTNVLSAVPEIAGAYMSYPHYVLRTDLLRYLLLWYYGGFYADMDVFPARSIKTCPDLKPLFFADDDKQKPTPRNVSLILGIELDEPYISTRGMREWHWTRRYGFMQYTMYAPRRFSPLLREIITRVIAHTKQHNERLSSYIGRYSQNAVLGMTGPDVVTDAVLDVLSATLPTTHELVDISMKADAGIDGLPVSKSTGKTQRRVTWAPFHRIQSPLCIDDGEAKLERSMGGLCVLPINAWGNGQRHSGSEGFNGSKACINHRFSGSWKKRWWQSVFG
ncbi:hypothetical protein UA08_01118 [Talaromyces atroroseus]|uniref:Initiation-specific alpha-1,6-mannosyltransferase n=1 Tax=Talaromyces atroroseus TaxID=1441469 RepID=A0A225AW62_TALAT|nr:hypothetical protein UA08_01118 [Talaromyces atroroseus]OKL63853.1 hypothetical protein UA08_01118 [Talaromyces atroroseus]